jgi:hypothetical protein
MVWVKPPEQVVKVYAQHCFFPFTAAFIELTGGADKYRYNSTPSRPKWPGALN